MKYFSLLAALTLLITLGACRNADHNSHVTQAPEVRLARYTAVSQAFFDIYKETGRFAPGAYSMVEKPGRGYWDFFMKRGVPGKDGFNDREQAVWPSDLPELIRANLNRGMQVPSWAPCPRTLSNLGMAYIIVGDLDEPQRFNMLQTNFKGEEICGTCPSPKTLHNDDRFSKGYAALMYGHNFFRSFKENGEVGGQDIVLNNKPLSAYFGKPYGRVPVVKAVIVLMLTPTTELGSHYDWSADKPESKYDYPLVFIAVEPYDLEKEVGRAEILGMTAPDGSPINIKR